MICQILPTGRNGTHKHFMLAIVVRLYDYVVDRKEVMFLSCKK